jgi:hypothetical protein
MKRTILLFIFGSLIAGCSNSVKTHHQNGKIASEYFIDHEGKKDGLYRVYNIDGKLEAETEMIHDSMSGFAKFYNTASGKIEEIVKFQKGIYNIPLSDSDFGFKINAYTFTEVYHYNIAEKLMGYGYVTKLKNHSNSGIIVNYNNDSISLIYGTPILSSNYARNDKSHIQYIRLTVWNIPKCNRNFYVMDSSDNTLDSCIGCKDMNIQIDDTKYYSIKTEYIDSAFHIKHSLREPFINCDRSRYPDGNRSLKWSRE